MIPEYFVQTEYNDGNNEGKTVKTFLTLSYAIKILSLGFVVLSAIFSEWWYLFGFVGLYAVGIILRQSVLSRTEAYEYFLVKDTLKISVRNNFGVQKYLCEIILDNICSVEVVKSEEVVKTDKTSIFAYPERKSITKINFIENTNSKNLYFAPSKYMAALIHKRQKYDLS